MICITEKMVAGGSCLARLDGKAVFIPFSLPGETLDIKITEDRKDYSFAHIVTVLEASPHRVVPLCPLFGKCGGCSLQMAENEYQKELRLSILNNVLNRAHVDFEGELSIESGNQIEYRSRFQFHRSPDGEIGFSAASSNTIIPIRDCPIAVPEIRAALQNGSLAKNARHSNTASRFHVFGYGGKLWNEDGETSVPLLISGERVQFDVRGFFQSNIPMLERLIERVSENMSSGKQNRFLDFYAGVGTFSVFAGKNFRETVLVEHNREALDLAKSNLSARPFPPTLCAVSDEKWPLHQASRLLYDTAIVDPPRQGIGKKALEWFISSNIPDVRYVSCDPVTFARDAAKLIGGGYKLTKVVLFDFYPQTHHIETIGFFQK